MATRSRNVSELGRLNEARWQAVNQSARALKAGADKIVETKGGGSEILKRIEPKESDLIFSFSGFLPEALLLKTHERTLPDYDAFQGALAGPQGRRC